MKLTYLFIVTIFISCSSHKISNALKVVDLSNKKLSEVPMKIIRNNKNAESLILSNNLILEFPQNIFEFKSLKTLSLKNNDIDRIPVDIYILNKLETLDIRGTKQHLQARIPGSLLLSRIVPAMLEIYNSKKIRRSEKKVKEQALDFGD